MVFRTDSKEHLDFIDRQERDMAKRLDKTVKERSSSHQPAAGGLHCAVDVVGLGGIDVACLVCIDSSLWRDLVVCFRYW